MKLIISSIMASILLCAPVAGVHAAAPDGKHSVKINANIGLGSAYSISSGIDDLKSDKSGSNTFGIDYRYRFWKGGNLSLGINAGLAYSTGSMTLGVDNMSFNYSAGADADMDGDAYQRYTTIRDMSQKVSLSEFGVPVYVDFNWQFSQRFALYVEAGLGFRFSTSATVNDLTGTCDVYGIYPKYDNLKMDDEWLNDFGEHSLSKATIAEPKQNSMTMHLRAGAGFRVWIYGPVSLECGVNYNYGLMNRLKVDSYSSGATTPGNAPMTYTVAGGRNIKVLSSGLDKSKLSNLNLHIGLIFSF